MALLLLGQWCCVVTRCVKYQSIHPCNALVMRWVAVDAGVRGSECCWGHLRGFFTRGDVLSGTVRTKLFREQGAADD